jgi:hypothetical protein
MRNIVNVSIVLLCSLLMINSAIAEPPALPENARVARAMFTTGIANREPVDRIVALANDQTEIFFFTDLRHFEGRTIKHVWTYKGEVVSEVPYAVTGPRWRVNSRKALDPSMTGKYTVWVVDQEGWPLHASIFYYYTAR